MTSCSAIQIEDRHEIQLHRHHNILRTVGRKCQLSISLSWYHSAQPGRVHSGHEKVSNKEWILEMAETCSSSVLQCVRATDRKCQSSIPGLKIVDINSHIVANSECQDWTNCWRYEECGDVLYIHYSPVRHHSQYYQHRTITNMLWHDLWYSYRLSIVEQCYGASDCNSLGFLHTVPWSKQNFNPEDIIQIVFLNLPCGQSH